jgi:hypothetical protein
MRIGEFREFQLDAQIRLVRADSGPWPRHADARKRIRQVDVQGFLEHGADQLLHDRRDLGFGQEGGFDIDLGEFGLAVGAQILVAEALGDLVVAVEAGHHQQLLEQLRRLRQGEELAGMHARGHQVVARAFGRRLGQHRRFDVDETLASRKRRKAIATL